MAWKVLWFAGCEVSVGGWGGAEEVGGGGGGVVEYLNYGGCFSWCCNGGAGCGECGGSRGGAH